MADYTGRYPTLAEALVSLRPGAEWSLAGGFETLQWHDQIQTQPTEQELYIELDRLRAEWLSHEYQRQRVKAYPSIENQLDTLFHQGYDGWKASIQSIKDQYPKPE